MEESENNVRQRKTGDDTANAKEGDVPDSTAVIMKRKLGLLGGIALVVGTIIGSGIFVSPKGITREVGSSGLSLVVWALCGVLTLIASLSYAELGTLIPESGGEYPYLKYSFGKKPGFVLAYLYSWTAITVVRPSSAAIIILVSAEYFVYLFFDDGCGTAPADIIKITAIVMILILTFLNCYSVDIANRIQIFFLGAKLLSLTIIIIGGFVKLGQGYTGALSDGFAGSNWSPGPIAIAFYNGMWAYDGWNQLNLVTEELINPNKNFPLALIIGIPLCMVVYILTNISYFSVMSVEELLNSPGVATTWAENVIPNAVWIIPLSVAMSAFGAGNGSLFAAGRLNFAAARDGNIMKIVSYVHVKHLTPYPALIILSFITILFVLPGDIDSLIDLFSFTIWLFYSLTFLAVIILRFIEPYKSMNRPFKVPLALPIIAFLAGCYLVVAPLIDSPKIEFLYATLFVFAGLILYVPFVHFKFVLPGTNQVTTFVQLFLQVAPPPDFDMFAENEEASVGEQIEPAPVIHLINDSKTKL